MFKRSPVAIPTCRFCRRPPLCASSKNSPHSPPVAYLFLLLVCRLAVTPPPPTLGLSSQHLFSVLAVASSPQGRLRRTPFQCVAWTRTDFSLIIGLSELFLTSCSSVGESLIPPVGLFFFSFLPSSVSGQAPQTVPVSFFRLI